MESDKLSVGLELDTTEYAGNIQEALELFRKFEKNFEQEYNIKINTSDIVKVATKQISNLQKAMDAIDDRSSELNNKLKTASANLEQAKLDREGTFGSATKAADKKVAAYEAEIANLKSQLKANENNRTQTFGNIQTLFKDLESLANLKFDEVMSPELAVAADKAKQIGDNSKNISDNFDEAAESARKLNKEEKDINDKAGILSTIIARTTKQIKRQMYTSLASLLNPINNFKKVFSYLTDTLSPRLGATFKNIKNNFIEYFASSDFFKNIIHQALYLVYIFQTLFNVIAKIFGWKNMDLFKRSAKSAKEIEKSASKTTASFDEINDIGNQGNDDNVPLGAGELFSAEEMNKATSIASKFEGIVKRVKEDIDNIKKYWKEILAVLIIVASVIALIKLADLFTSAKGNDGGITNLTGLADGVGKLASKAGDALVIISMLGGIALVLNQLNDLLNTLNNMTGDATKKMQGLAIIIVSLSALVLALALAAQLCASPACMIALAEIALVISGILLVMEATLPTILDASGKFIEKVAPPLINLLNTIKDVIQIIIKQLGESLPPIVESIGNLFTKIFNGVVNVINSVGNVIVEILKTVDTTVSNVFTSILNFIERLGPAINKCVDGIIEAVTKVINFFVSGIEYLINTIIIKPINKLINKVTGGAIGELLDWAGIPKLKTISTISIDRFVPKLATGTNFVPEDTLAYIHQGEAVIPKKFNEKEYFGGSNDETNSLLEELISKVDNIDFSPYTTIKDVGKASIEYIKNTSRQLGRSVI